MKENLLKLQVYAKIKKDQFLHEERGEVNMIAIIMIIAVVIVLAVVFKDGIASLLESLFGKLKTNGENAITNMTGATTTP